MQIVELAFCDFCQELLYKPSISAWGWNKIYFGTVRMNDCGDSWWICPPPPQIYIPSPNDGLHKIGNGLVSLAKMHCLLHPEDLPPD